jgi:hypothetical protein
MIVVKLYGGLGNQMFQYATARRLAHRWQTIPKLDVSGFAKDELRSYNLDIFNIQATFATSVEIDQLVKMRQSQGWLAKMQRQTPSRPSTYIREQQFRFMPFILDLPNHVYLDGYWQSEKYFVEIANLLRQEFRFRKELQGENKQLAEKIAACEAVSLHIRRGDYVTNPVANQVLGVCSLEYYQRSVERVTQTLSSPCFFIFSDDPQWAEAHLRLPYSTTIVAHNRGEQSYEDMRLMSLCKHHIIANSSFSWWGAWLCAYPQKVVIAPQRWFNSSEWDATDLVPDSWIRL